MMQNSWRHWLRHSAKQAVGRSPRRVAVAVLACTLTHSVAAQPPKSVSRPLPIEAAQRSFRVAEPNLAIELVISEPRVVNPVAVTWDADSHLYVLEVTGYGTEQPKGRVKRLVDFDGDWLYDRGSYYARDLDWPRAMLPWRDGLLVYAGSDIIYLRDTNDDGEADERRVVLTGLGEPEGRGLPTGGLVRGLDNWIYAVANRAGVRVQRPDAADSAVDVPNYVFRFQPDTNRCEPVAGGGAVGMTFDDWGHRFVSISDALPVSLVAIERQFEQKRGASVSNVVDTIPATDSARLFPTSLASRRWNAARGEYLQAASSLEVFRGNRLTPRCLGSLFVCQPEGNLLHSRTLRSEGATLISERSDQGREFLSSTDPCFRPVQAATGPDGHLYVVDFYRPTLERPAGDDATSSKVDFSMGEQYGRIWRIVKRERLGAFRPDAPQAEPHPARARLNFVDNLPLVHLLQHANGWWRDTAQRLLIERNARDMEPQLRALVEQPGNVRARVHAMWTLEGLGLLSDASLVVVLNEFHPYLVANAVRLAEPRLENSPELRAAVLARARDRLARVRFQVALAAAPLSGDDVQLAITGLLQGPVDDPLFRSVLLSATAQRPWQYLELATADDPTWFSFPTTPRLDLLRGIARQVGLHNKDTEVSTMLNELGSSPEGIGVTHLALLDGLQQGLAESNRSLAEMMASPTGELSEGLKAIVPVVQYGQGVASDTTLDAASRAYGIAVLPLAGRAASAELMLRLLDQSPADALAVAALRSLIQIPATTYIDPTLASWPKLSPVAREELVAALLASPDRIRYLVAAVEKGTIPPSELDGAAQYALAHLPDANLRSRALATLPKASSKSDASWEKKFAAVDTANADRAAGAATFAKNCQSCHQLMQFGTGIGPGLDEVGAASPAMLREMILRPNHLVAPRFDVRVGITSNGAVVLGRLRFRTPERVGLGRTDGRIQTIETNELASLEATHTGFMPTHWETALSPEQLAQLVEFLRQPEHNFLLAIDSQRRATVSLLFDGKIPDEVPETEEAAEAAAEEEVSEETPPEDGPKRRPRIPSRPPSK